MGHSLFQGSGSLLQPPRALHKTHILISSTIHGQTEKKLQDIGRYLRSFCHQNQHGWNHFLPWAEYAHNSLRQQSTGLTPSQCQGYQLPLFPWDGEPSEVPAVDFWFREREMVWDSGHVQLQQAVYRQKTHADARHLSAPPYQPGDKVWLSTQDICLQLPCRKRSAWFIGPLTIRRLINKITYQLDLPPTYSITPTFQVSLLKPQTNPMSPSSPGPDEPEVPPPPEIDNKELI